MKGGQSSCFFRGKKKKRMNKGWNEGRVKGKKVESIKGKEGIKEMKERK